MVVKTVRPACNIQSTVVVNMPEMRDDSILLLLVSVINMLQPYLFEDLGGLDH
jgi:hypothetical protein